MKRKGLIILMVTAVLLFGVKAYAQAEIAPQPMISPLEAMQLQPLNIRTDKDTGDFLKDMNHDADGRGDIFTNKFGDGVVNLSTFWIDLPYEVSRVTAEENILSGVTYGFASGLVSGAKRGVSGTYDTATFMVPPYNDPAMSPEYAVDKPNQEGFKVSIFSW